MKKRAGVIVEGDREAGLESLLEGWERLAGKWEGIPE